MDRDVVQVVLGPRADTLIEFGMELVETDIPGVMMLQAPVHKDARGTFVKTFHADAFAKRGLETNFGEQYHSRSAPGVVRGLHFQTPPHDHAKLVYCSAGDVFDVALDLRVGSPTFGEHRSFRLRQDSGTALYLPRGIAHGFCAVDDWATLHYSVTSPYAREHDAGVRWDSAGVDWPVREATIVSERDSGFPTLEQFVSPFTFKPSTP